MKELHFIFCLLKKSGVLGCGEEAPGRCLDLTSLGLLWSSCQLLGVPRPAEPREASLCVFVLQQALPPLGPSALLVAQLGSALSPLPFFSWLGQTVDMLVALLFQGCIFSSCILKDKRGLEVQTCPAAFLSNLVLINSRWGVKLVYLTDNGDQSTNGRCSGISLFPLSLLAAVLCFRVWDGFEGGVFRAGE